MSVAQPVLERVNSETHRPLVIYHAGCKDGFGSAWVAKKALTLGDMQVPEFYPATYGAPPPDVKGREVYMIDFSYKRDILKGMIAVARKMVILDHHKTAQADLMGINDELAHMGIGPAEIIFDMERSGIGIAWDYFMSQTRPWIVNYVEDRDIWRWALPDSRNVNAFLASLKYDFDEWDYAERQGLQHALTIGKELIKKADAYNDALCNTLRQYTEFDGVKDVPIINAPQEGISELMEEMLKRDPATPFCLAWRLRSDGRVAISLRSTAGPNSWDVSATAAKWGGGGHMNAAGFELRGHAAMAFLLRLVKPEGVKN